MITSESVLLMNFALCAVSDGFITNNLKDMQLLISCYNGFEKTENHHEKNKGEARSTQMS